MIRLIASASASGGSRSSTMAEPAGSGRGGGLEGTGISDQLGGAHGVIKRRLRSRKNLTLGEAGRRFQGLEVFRRLPDLQVRGATHAGGRCRYPFPLVGGQPAQPVEEGLDLNGVGPEPLVAHVT